MKRELFDWKLGKHVNGCCPGHDDYPSETYRNKRSKKKRSEGKAKEHRYVRRFVKRMVNMLIGKD